ncbi:hypothetical protein ACS0TY_025953 [Phlomoides rotata]
MPFKIPTTLALILRSRRIVSPTIVHHNLLAVADWEAINYINDPHYTVIQSCFVSLKTYPNLLQDNLAYSAVRQYFVDYYDTVAQKIVVHKDTPRGIHFRRAGPRQRASTSSIFINYLYL